MCVFNHVRNFMDAPAPGAPILSQKKVWVSVGEVLLLCPHRKSGECVAMYLGLMEAVWYLWDCHKL